LEFPAFKEINYETANELWDALSPTKSLFNEPCNLVYRGQADSTWKLIPSLLRDELNNPLLKFIGNKIKSDELVFTEVQLLNIFAEYCDNIGVRVPNDSIKFRSEILNSDTQDKYYITPSLWPNPDLIELMALAQHHGVPTRLLDWTRQPYVSAYFAVSAAMSNYKSWKDGSKLSVWVLNTTKLALYPNVNLVQVPGSTSPHLSAQSGLFTVHPHSGSRGEHFKIHGLETEFKTLPDTPLIKLTLPVMEANDLYRLCQKVGLNGATIYPSADGAGKAVQDSINAKIIKDGMG